VRILIADDDHICRYLLCKIVENHFKEIYEARNGVDAVEQARDYQPDVILMDVQMPQMDGFTALERLKADEATALIPVVMISAGHVMPADIKRGFDLGARDYVKKPFNIFELPKMLERYAMEAKKKVRDGPGLRNPDLIERSF